MKSANSLLTGGLNCGGEEKSTGVVLGIFGVSVYEEDSGPTPTPIQPPSVEPLLNEWTGGGGGSTWRDDEFEENKKYKVKFTVQFKSFKTEKEININESNHKRITNIIRNLKKYKFRFKVKKMLSSIKWKK